MTRKIDALLSEYGESHQNPTNKAVHWICVPVIVWSVMALISLVPLPFGMSLLTPVLAAALLYYLVLSPALALGMAVYVALCLAVLRQAETLPLPVWQVALGAFVLAWIGQFWGHKVEGRKPSFFKDVQFLLIGPAWLLSFLYRRMGVAY